MRSRASRAGTGDFPADRDGSTRLEVVAGDSHEGAAVLVVADQVVNRGGLRTIDLVLHGAASDEHVHPVMADVQGEVPGVAGARLAPVVVVGESSAARRVGKGPDLAGFDGRRAHERELAHVRGVVNSL